MSVGSHKSRTKVTKTIENVISALDRRSVSVLPKIGKALSEGIKHFVLKSPLYCTAGHTGIVVPVSDERMKPYP